MADKKISALTSATTPLAGTEVLPIVQSGATVKVPVSSLTAGRVVAAEGVIVGGGSFASWGLYKAAQVGPTGVFSNVSGTTRLGDNFYYDGSDYRYLTSSFVSMMQFNGGAGGFTFFGAPSGTAGNTISFTQSLDMSAAGNMTLNTGNLVIGTSGKGIDFSATPGTGTSELFADYEEGTWTPAAGANLAVVGTPTYTGQYTKVGNTVTAWGSVSSTTSVAYTAGGQILSGLPFTAQGIIAVGTVINNAFTFSSSIATLPTTGFLYGAEAMVATSAIYFQVTYHV